jgi:hypothetical protein
MRWIRFAVAVSLAGCLCVAGPAAAQPRPDPVGPPAPAPAGSLPWLVDRIVPPPVVPLPSASSRRLAADPGLSQRLWALRAAVMPAPAGDPFFDRWPAHLDRYADGQIIETRDVTPTAAPIIVIGVQRVVQLKFRTTDAHGQPSFGTATLVVPAGSLPGAGSRPVLVNNLPIDSLGRVCTPSYTLAHGISGTTSLTDYIPPVTHLAALRGYAVLIPDYEGARMAYAEPYVAGHVVLDAIRAVRDYLPDEFGDSRFAMQGYSGGSIATYGAAKLIDSYAPDLRSAIVGAAMGGVPADFAMLTHTMNGNWAAAVFVAAVFGIGRERPEILTAMNNLAGWVATSPLKDQCISNIGGEGVLLPLPIDVAADIVDPLDSPLAQQVLRATAMTGLKSATPLFIYNGEQEFWIPAAGARELFRQQCALGANARYLGVPGEHVIAAVTGFVPAMLWLDQRLQGVPAPDGC